MTSTLRFRNVDASPTDPVGTWPIEAMQTAIERGHLSDWRRIVAAVRSDPWGPVARRVEYVLRYSRPYGTAGLLEQVIEVERRRAETADRVEVARRMTAAVTMAGLSQAGFAAGIGTSQPRLSTYLTGSVTPSAALLLRAERFASASREHDVEALSV